MRVTVFDYGAGNLHSLVKALAGSGREVAVVTDAAELAAAELLVLPGVGAFPQAAGRLAPARAALRDALRDGLPCVGICLGMQLLFERSDEGEGEGLALIEGPVTRLRARRVPHIGWNAVSGDDPMLAASGLELGYFANGFAGRPADASCVTAWTDHDGDRFPSIVRAARAVGVQFHPEKSSAAGVRLLHAALEGVLVEVR
ncbi:MAG: imidazole glycerol phosphate synthase subunit HisH [Gemmatimonadales bacterium]